MNLSSLKIGDLIVRKKGIFSTHFMVYIGMQKGVHMVAENQTGVGVRYTSLEQALAGNAIERFEKFGGTEAQRNMVIPRIESLLGKTYDLVVFNCEHFARWIANNKVESKQVKLASTAAIIGGAAMLGHNNNNMKAFGVLTIITGIIAHASQR